MKQTLKKKKKSIQKFQSNFFSLLLTGFPDLHILLVQILRSILLVFKEVVWLNQKEKSKVRTACFFPIGQMTPLR